MDNPTCIYALADPRKPSEIRYIGKTRNRLRNRLFQHINGVNRYACHRSNWIRAVLKEGHLPIIWPLEFISEESWQERERFWVTFFKPLGLLTNHDDGGRGCHRMPATKEETRRKMSLARKGKKWTPEVRERMMKLRRGKPRTQRQIEQFRSMLKIRKPRVYTPEGLRRLRESKRGLIRTQKQIDQLRNMILTRRPPVITEEWRQNRRKINAARKGRPISERHKGQLLKIIKSRCRPVRCIDTDEVFESLSEAARAYRGVGCKILNAIRRGGTFCKMKWEFIKKETI